MDASLSDPDMGEPVQSPRGVGRGRGASPKGRLREETGNPFENRESSGIGTCTPSELLLKPVDRPWWSSTPSLLEASEKRNKAMYDIEDVNKVVEFKPREESSFREGDETSEPRQPTQPFT